jgi:hypothetical protein
MFSGITGKAQKQRSAEAAPVGRKRHAVTLYQLHYNILIEYLQCIKNLIFHFL